jgi:hypothetical protein
MIFVGKPTEMMTDAAAAAICVEVVYALPERYWSVRLEMANGATVLQALDLAGLERQVEGIVIDPERLAIFSRPAKLSTRLRDGDRLEVLRPLLADPKQSRRTRAVGSLPGKR